MSVFARSAVIQAIYRSFPHSDQIDALDLDTESSAIRFTWRGETSAVMLLDEIAEHFAGEADADQPQGCDYPIPNTAMRFQQRCDELTARAQ